MRTISLISSTTFENLLDSSSCFSVRRWILSKKPRDSRASPIIAPIFMVAPVPAKIPPATVRPYDNPAVNGAKTKPARPITVPTAPVATPAVLVIMTVLCTSFTSLINLSRSRIILSSISCNVFI